MLDLLLDCVIAAVLLLHAFVWWLIARRPL